MLITPPSTSSSNELFVPAANAVRDQFASRPTLESVTRQTLTASIVQRYPSLTIDLSRTLLATPMAQGGWELPPLMPLVMDYLANNTALDLSPVNSQAFYLCDEPPTWLQPAEGSIDMKVIEALIKELPFSLPITLQHALTEYWRERSDTGVSRWRWLSEVLKDSLSISVAKQAGLSDSSRETLRQVISYPVREERRQIYGDDATSVYGLESTLSGAGLTKTLLNTRLLFVRANNFLLCKPGDNIRSFSTIEALNRVWGMGLATRYLAETITIKRCEPEGDIFDTQAAMILNVQMETLSKLSLPTNVGLQALQTFYWESTDPAQYLRDAPKTTHQALNTLAPHLPQWLRSASASDQSAYRQYALAVANAKKSSKGNTFLSGITDIHTYAAESLLQQMKLDQKNFEPLPDEQSDTATFLPDDVALTFTTATGLPGAVGIVERITMSLTDLALKNLVGKPEGLLTLSHRRGLALPHWLTPEYITKHNGLIEQVNIGKAYPEKLDLMLLSDSDDARQRQKLFEEHLKAHLPLHALELSLKQECGLTPLGVRHVAALMKANSEDRNVDDQPVVIRHLALVRKLGAQPDIVRNMFIIEPLDSEIGPHLLYRPFYEHSLYEFTSRRALLETIAAPGELQDSVLTWLNDSARPIYDNGGFHQPHYVHFGLGSDFSPIEIPAPATLAINGTQNELLQFLQNNRVCEYLYASNARALVEQADRDAVANSESRWSVLFQGGNLLFNAVLAPFLRGPAMLTHWLLSLIAIASQDIATLNSKDAPTRELAAADLLLNLAMVLFHWASGTTLARPVIADTLSSKVLKPGIARRIAERWPAAPLPNIIEGPIAFAGELPLSGKTALDFSFASTRNRLTPSQRMRLSRFEVHPTDPLPPPLSEHAQKGLYLIDNTLYAQLEGSLYQVSAEPEGVVIVGSAEPDLRGPYLKSTPNGEWSLDLRLRLQGGMPNKRINALRQRNAERVAQLNADVETFKKQDPERHKRIVIAQKIMVEAEVDTRFTPEQNNAHRRQLDATLQEQITTYQQLLESNKERIELGIPLEQENVILLLKKTVKNILISLSLAARDQKYITQKWFQFNVHGQDLDEVINANPTSFKSFLQEMVEFNERGIQRLELKEQYINELYNLGPAGVEAFASLTDNSPKEGITALSLKSVHLQTLKLASTKMSAGTLIQDSLDATIDPLQEQVRTHEDLTNLDFPARKRQEVLDSLVEHYGQALDALHGLNIVNADELESEYFEKLLNVLDALYQDATAQLATEIKPSKQTRKRPPKRPVAQPGSPKKQVINTRHKGNLIGTVVPSSEQWPIETIEVRSGYDNQLLSSYSKHGEVWDEIKTLSPPRATSSRAFNIIKADARKCFAKLEEHLRKANRYKAISKYPQELEEVLNHEADKLDKLAGELDMAIEAKPPEARLPVDQTLVADLLIGAKRLRAEGKTLRTQLSFELPPTHSNLQYLLDQDLVHISGLGKRKPLTGERQDFIQEYAINDRRGSPIWYAHFHYPAMDTPKSDYVVAHLKTKEQRKQSYYTQLANAQSGHAIVNVHRGRLGKVLAEQKFLPLAS